MNHNIPPTILIFDSGVGGLSVFYEIQKVLPHANYIYVFDDMGYPYGELAPDILIERVNEMLRYVVDLHRVDIVVIGCNTASTIVLPSLREFLSVPVVGVVPAIKPASLISNTAVGLIATPATVKREYTHNLIRDYLLDVPIKLLGTTELVDMAENKLKGKPVCLVSLQRVLQPLIGKIDVAVLGCTHFPLLRNEIKHVFGNEIRIIDSGEAIARRVQSLINNSYIARAKNNNRKCIAYNSAPTIEGALNITFKKMGFEAIERIPTQDV
ncbi:glutamate racemase [Vibrio algarum]|uniref:Glutamate racemase n=1 Tax=Vibrio algarum TaxID=3020714 RepID=A0ABT4YMD1_9VIBR|nr:glutamate racemase [Vibrio sp. KJ40-1]MDB1122707.1 glutamate racemase [Vibrio sp. KJ40-1]